MLGIFETFIKSNKKVKPGFDTLLKKKFVEKADKFVFLDPFTAEFEYADQKITFTGEASGEELVKGLTECVKELAEGLGILTRLNDELGPWAKKYEKELEKYHVDF